MKKWMVMAMLLAGFASWAQENAAIKSRKEDRMTAQQRTELQVKRMTLELGLNASQQKQMSDIIAEQHAKREAAMKERSAKKDSKKDLTADERFAMKSRMLDERIAMKEKVRKVLTAEQFDKWEKMNSQKRHMAKRNIKDRKRERNDENGKK